jgi:hypothetical protein
MEPSTHPYRPPPPRSSGEWTRTQIIVGLAGLGFVAFFIPLMAILNAAFGLVTDEDRAKMGVQTLDKAVATFHARHNSYPTTLLKLTQRQPDGTAPLLDTAALMDPWGYGYVYDLDSRQLGTNKPRIFSKGRPGENQRFCNWD